jgi:hypothetical protein
MFALHNYRRFTERFSRYFIDVNINKNVSSILIQRGGEQVMETTVLRKAALKNRALIMPPYDAIIDMEGFEAVCAFCDFLGGTSVYIPNKRTVFQHCLEKEAMREFNGHNYQFLSAKYGFSQNHFRKLAKILRPN